MIRAISPSLGQVRSGILDRRESFRIGHEVSPLGQEVYVISLTTALLIIPSLGTGIALQNSDTPYSVSSADWYVYVVSISR